MILYLQDKYYEEVPGGSEGYQTDNYDQMLKLPDTGLAFERKERFFVGAEGDVAVDKTALLVRITGNEASVSGSLEGERVYRNQRKLRDSRFPVRKGDCLLMGKVKIIFYPGYIQIFGDSMDYSTTLVPVEKRELPFEGFPNYKRSPRIVKRAPQGRIEIKSPPEKEAADKGGLAMLILPSLATSAVTVGIGLMMGRGMYLLMSLGVTGVTIVMSVIRFFSERKEQQETNRKNREAYEAYLLRKRKEIYQAYEAEQESYRYNFPKISRLNSMAHSFDNRIYERLATDDDFLVFSIGERYSAASCSISLPEAEISADKDEMYQEAEELKREFSFIWSAATVDLKRSHLGLVGSKPIVHQQLQIYLCQLALFHSYRDLQMIVLYDDKYGADFKWMEWLPHCRISALNVRGLVHSEKSRDQILNSLSQIMKERQQKLEESKKEARFLPHFLFVIDEPKYIMDHSIMEYLSGDGGKLGFSLIYTSYLRANLPDYIGTVLLLEHAREGKLLLKEREFSNESIRLPEGGSINLELFARDLGVLNHLLGTSSHIPESITFFEMYKVLNPEELDIEKRWRSHCANKSLGVPLGVRAVEDIVELNLHEKAHGPHGLVAGTTGSGKSEIIQSYILSLAVNFHPHEVGFLLIDYKGGGMAGLFRNLPHLLGTITNLDGSESMRALASIKSELARRQKLFGDNHVNHINGYMSLFREGKVAEPVPHLFLISDEFAELKKEQPEFMKELVSTARIGRSLGVHLILATQKPSGVVDDQIWTNSKFKLALKVQNESDSKEILKTPDAASITQAGRAYLQVGNNEIYELFQSAWSGALYLREQEREVTLDHRVYRVNDLGQRVLINQDLGGSRAENTSRETQLDATIAYIQKLYEGQKAAPVQRPWLPALKPVLVSPCRGMEKGESGFLERGIEISLGLVDVPEEQRQADYIMSFTEDGNLMYIASGGYGKSLLLTTIAISISLRYRVREANLFVLDFGNNGLIPLQKLPHTAEYITLDDTERYQKFKNLLSKEIKQRKRLLAEALAQNYQVYNQTSDRPICAWIILVDNFDAVKELGFDEEEYFTRVTRDGTSLGIYFAIAATRMNAIRGATYNNFKNKIAGFNFERGEVLSIVGRSPYVLPEIKGRAMVKYGERVSCMQIYTMVPFENNLEYRSGISSLIEEIRLRCGGQEAPHMPIMPEEVTLGVMERFHSKEIDLYLGLERENVTLEGIRMTDSPFIVLGAAGSGKTNLLKVLLHQLSGEADVAVFDSPARELRGCETMERVRLVKNIEEFVSFMDDLEKEVTKREQQMKGCPASEEEEKLRKMDRQAIVIDDLTTFFSRQTTSEEEIADMLVRAANVGILVIATNLVSKFYGSDPVSEMFQRSAKGVLVSPQGHLGAAPVDLEPGVNEGILYGKGRKLALRIPKA